MGSDPENLSLYLPEEKRYATQHYTQSFGKPDVYESYFSNFPSDHQAAFRKFGSIQKVDRALTNELTDPIWIMQRSHQDGVIRLPREDVNEFRKYLFLLNSLGSKDQNMHLFAHNRYLDEARKERHHFRESHGLDHVRDVWLTSVERMIDTSHYEIPENTTIFSLDRLNYKANAMDRYMVFWEAAPNEEFILTDSAFGGFEGGQIGGRPNSNVSVGAAELGKRLFTRETMWHQIFILSPTLAVALCHPTLMHPDLAKQHRRRWGLRKSLLEALPHQLPLNYYKDMKKESMIFYEKDGFTITPEIEQCFASPNQTRIGPAELEFPIHRLQPGQAAMVNSVLLHNQESGPKIKAVCMRPARSMHSFLRSLKRFHTEDSPWERYSQEKQNDYTPLIQQLEHKMSQALPPTPPNIQLSTNGMYQQHLGGHPVFPDVAPAGFGNMAYSTVSTTADSGYSSRYDLRFPLSPAQSTLASFTPSSQSSYSHSSASSQSSASTKTTSVENTPRSEPKRFQPEHQRRTSGVSSPRDRSISDSSLRRSNTSSKAQRSAQRQSVDLHKLLLDEMSLAELSKSSTQLRDPYVSQYGTIDGHLSGYSSPYSSVRGRGPEPQVRSNPSSGPSSKRASPNPIFSDAVAPPPPTHAAGSIPAKKDYAADSRRPHTVSLTNRPSQAAPQPQQRRGRSPERYAPVPEAPPRRGDFSAGTESPARPAPQRNSTTTEHLYQSVPQTEGPRVDARGRRYQPVTPGETPRSRPVSMSFEAPELASQHMIEAAVQRLQAVVNNKQEQSAQQPPSRNRSPERKADYGMAPPTRQQQRQPLQPISLPELEAAVAVAQQATQPPAHFANSAPSSGSTEHSTRPGVSYIRQRVSSQNSSDSSEAPQKQLLMLPYQEYQEPVVKQLRFDESLTHAALGHKASRESLTSCAESMLAQAGDIDTLSMIGSEYGDSVVGPYYDEESQVDEDDDEDYESETEGEDGRWEDEAAVEAEIAARTKERQQLEQQQQQQQQQNDQQAQQAQQQQKQQAQQQRALTTTTPKKNRHVRFADKPLPSPKALMIPMATTMSTPMSTIGKGIGIERPNSRLGVRKVEIPRPLSRNGHNPRFARPQPARR
ncbi:hypothetical protein BZA77DRAFT_359759 [Pyronema omphalodes]|nr:hypothetical protein BZA77DRAFT_359759 [Pyronema omphalodes]